MLYRYLQLSRQDTLADGSIRFVDQPNTAVSLHNGSLNIGRLARIITASPNFTRFQYGFVGAFLGCEPFENFFTPDGWQKRRSSLITAANEPAGFARYPRSLFDAKILADFLASHSNRVDNLDPTEVLLKDGEFFDLAPFPLLQAIEKQIQRVNTTNLSHYQSSLLKVRPDWRSPRFDQRDLSRHRSHRDELGSARGERDQFRGRCVLADRSETAPSL